MLIVDYKYYRGSPEGNDCWFMESMGRGYKFYDYEHNRDLAHSRQSYLHSKGLAPAVYFKGEAEFDDDDATRMYFYETEIAETRANSDRPRKDFINQFVPLEEELRQVGVIFQDWIVGNVGFIDNRAVVIDCGFPMEFI